MTLKKHPEVDINRYRNLIFQICLVSVLLLANIAFEWRSYDEMSLIDISSSDYEILNQLESKAPSIPKPAPNDSIRLAAPLPEEDIILSISVEYTP